MSEYYLKGYIEFISDEDEAVKIARKNKPAVIRCQRPAAYTFYVATLSKTPIQPGQVPFILTANELAKLERN